MELCRLRERFKIVAFGVCVFAAALLANTVSGTTQIAECSSGKLSAKLTGWAIEGKMPRGSAEYVMGEGAAIKVTLESVNLSDGTVLAVFDGDNHIGDMPALKGGNVTGSIATTKALSEGSYIKVMNEDLPIVTGGLSCSKEGPK